MKDIKEMMTAMSNKDKETSLSKQEIQAKIDVLKELLDMASHKAGEDVIGGLKKVTVAAPDKAGLEKGLDKAKELTSDMPMENNSDDKKAEMLKALMAEDSEDQSDMGDDEEEEEENN